MVIIMKITVFTPTYNRGELLEKLFLSLEAQSCKAFEWVIVDDGSTDNTEEVALNIKKKASFLVTYAKKKNGGKHTAINIGAQLAQAPWFFIVDSDDYLISNAIEIVLRYISTVECDEKFAGVAGLRGNSKGDPWEIWYKKNKEHTCSHSQNTQFYMDATCIDYRFKYKRQGDRAEIVRTELVKKYPFPQFDDEKFLVETHLWFNLAKHGYRFRWFDEVIYITEYREDGLTKNISKAYKNSPKGSTYTYNLILSCQSIPLYEQVRASYNYFLYGRIAGYKMKDLISQCNKKILLPIGLILSFIKQKNER